MAAPKQHPSSLGLAYMYNYSGTETCQKLEIGIDSGLPCFEWLSENKGSA